MRLLMLLVACLPFAALATAADQPPTTRPAPADPSTPRGALKACDQSLPAGGLPAARQLYHWTDRKYRPAVDAMAKSDLAAARLGKAVRDKFGDKAAEDALHAMRQFTSADIDAATETIDGDKASVAWPDDREPLEMVKIDGKWKVSVAAILPDADADTIKEVIETNGQLVKELDQTAKELAAGAYANAVLLERAIRQRVFRIMGDDD
ncbi:MAG TPA: hypothetical protein VH370_04895 [Humisphaera sp.]|jgi:hypothetical protein|nr:hypothetical protein [Humisphaera sp.]